MIHHRANEYLFFCGTSGGLFFAEKDVIKIFFVSGVKVTRLSPLILMIEMMYRQQKVC